MFPDPERNGFMEKILFTFQGLVLQEVSVVCAACSLQLYFDCSVFKSVLCRVPPCLQWGVFRPWPDCVSFNKAYFDLLAKRDLILFMLELKLCSSIIDMVGARFCAGFLGEGPIALVLRHTRHTRSTSQVWGIWECGTWCKKIQRPVLVLCYLLYFMLRCKGEKWHQPALLSQERQCHHCQMSSKT